MDQANTYTMDDSLNQLISIATENGKRISYVMVADMMKEQDPNITDEALQDTVALITDRGITVEPYEMDEDYQISTPEIPEGYFIPADVNIRPRPFTVGAMIDRLKYNEIDLNPSFQRHADLWNKERQSRLIESLMLQIPLPAFYFDATDDGCWIVIDGLQRLSAFKNYMVDKNFALSGLEYLTELEGYCFEELPRQYYRRIKEAQITVYTVEKGTPEAIVYNIFKRINTGGITLEPEEIRHALYQGKVTELIEKLAVSKQFLLATGGAIPTQRMRDYEYITRYLAFTQQDYKDYKDNIEIFLNNGLKLVNRYSDEEIAQIEQKFYAVMEACYQIFGKYAFRRISPNGRRGPINKAIFELWAVCLSSLGQKKLNVLIREKEAVFNGFAALFSDVAFSLAIKAGDQYSLASRIQKTQALLEDILHD